MKTKEIQKKPALIIAIVLVLAILCTVVGYMVKENMKNREQNLVSETTPEVTDSSSTQPTLTKPTLIVEGTKAKPGDKRVEVVIKVNNNPGILGIDYDLYYDDAVMTLVNAQSELDLEGCVYTPPAYYRNPSTFLWDFQDANWVEDGTVLKLYFDILDTAPVGEYEIKIMYSYGNIFDANLEPIDVGVMNGYVSVK